MLINRFIMLVAVMSGLICLGCARGALDANDARARQAGWKMAWSDEFDKEGLPDPKKWVHEEGFVRNEEAQYYTRRKENARVEGGMLVLEARKERMKNPGYRAGSQSWKSSREYAEYTAGSIKTKGLAAWRYGRFEIRARLPEGAGTWPAFWTVGVERGWPAGGEIDIMEWWGKNPGVMTSNLHYQVDGKHVARQGKMAIEKPSTEFHVYAMEWDAEKIDFFVDQTKYHTFMIEQAKNGDFNPYRQPHLILLNFALGGRSGGKIDDSKLPQQYVIDYVRVYQKQ